MDASILEISILSIFYTPEPPQEDNVIKAEIEKRTNTKLNNTWVSPNSYNEKVSVTLASGDMPDMLLVVDTQNPLVKSMAKQGAFWEITPFIDYYANLKALPADSWNNLKYEG